MDGIINFLKNDVPLWVYIAAGAAVLIIAALLTARGILRKIFSKRLSEIAEDPELAGPLIRKKYTPKRLLRLSSIIEKKTQAGPELISLTGIDDLWINRFSSRSNTRDFRRIVTYAPEKGLFVCFLAALEKKKYASMLNQWIHNHEDILIMRKIAFPGKGEDFDGEAALELFRDRVPQIREMLGDPEWPVRYFAVKILLHDDSEHSERPVWESFDDPYPLIRKTVVREYRTNYNDDKLYDKLTDILLNDPVLEVRREARNRIALDYSKQHSIDYDNLSDAQALHVLEVLDPDLDHDINIAMKYLDSENLELRFPPAVFLSRLEILHNLILDIDFKDEEKLERILKLLNKACEVNATGFLSVVTRSENPATLYIATQLFKRWGDRIYINTLAERIFSLRGLKQEYDDIYQDAVECISKRGDDKALELLSRELLQNKYNEEVAAFILEAIPERGDLIFRKILLGFLKDTSFKPRDVLRNTIEKLPNDYILPRLFEIVKAPRENYPHVVRKDAVKILGNLHLPYCIQFILENLHILPADEAKEFASVLNHYSEKVFNERVAKLLGCVDSSVRSAIIASLPATEKQTFIKDIRQALTDASPDVRIASVWALCDYEDTRSLNQAHEMLRDPVETVRSASGRVLGKLGSDKTLDKLKESLEDENEVEPVKTAIIYGLVESDTEKSVDILIDRLAVDEELEKTLSSALAQKTTKKAVSRLVEHFKDADHSLRRKIAKVFTRMGDQGGDILTALLEEDIASLKPFISTVLEEVGFVDRAIRRLKDRNASVRKEAAGFLSKVGTEAAFRGIVMAARDPEEDVRVQVTKALERLNTDDGKKILEALQNDPDKRIRKYTLWAIERNKAKAL